MTVYGPDITAAFEEYSTQFDDLKVQERNPIVDLNAINPLSELREEWQNVTTDATEHNLSTSASTDEIAYLETGSRGQYTAGYEAQAGIGVRIPTNPSKDEVIRWGYYTTDANQDPVDGWYFGVDKDGLFVCEVSNGTKDIVRQQSWSVDVADGDGDADENPSGFDISLSKGNIFQIEFVYYGYGPVNMEILTDDGKVRLHQFTHDGTTSVTNTNLPLNAQIDNGSTNSDALDFYVGGRQFSIIGQESTNNRRAGHYLDSISGIDDTKWYAAISFKLKDGTDIGSIDFSHVLCDVINFETDTDNSAYRWQLRRGTTPDNPTWETPTTHVDKQDETAVKVDTNSADVLDGNGDLTGVVVDAGTLSSGGNNKAEIQKADTSGQLSGNDVMTLQFQAVPGSSGTITETFLSWGESW